MFKRRPSPRSVIIGLLLLILIAPFVFLGQILDWFMWKASHDYSQDAPAVVFKRVTNLPISRGVSNLKVTGHSFFIKHWVWMRFQATDTAIKTLIGNAEKESNTKLLQSSFAGREDYNNDQDQQAVGWDEVFQIKNPELYEWYSLHGSAGFWYGVLVVDRRRNLVYIHATLE